MRVLTLRNAVFATFLGALLLVGCDAGNDSDSEAGPDGSQAAAEALGAAIALELAADRDQLGMSELDPPEYWPEDGTPRTDECCTDPGQANECWSSDAENDGVTCEVNADCPSSSCNTTLGLCECAAADECNSGVCLETGICGPSWCNGYSICSCWGGCEWWHADETYTPDDWAASLAMFCCEGTYPMGSEDPDEILSGFLSPDPTCGLGCTEDDECDDGNPCTTDMCTDNGNACETEGGCTYILNDGLACSFGSPSSTQSDDCIQERCRGTVGLDGCLDLATVECSVEAANIGSNCADNPQGVDAGWYGDAPRPVAGANSCYYQRCDDTGECAGTTGPADGLGCNEIDFFTGQPNTGPNTCTDELCLDGLCNHDPTDHIGEVCNNDNEGCTVDACQADGTCLLGDPPADCDDSNWCTYEDICDGNPDLISYDCINPLVSGDATLYGYIDSEDCSDLICVGGFEDPTPTDCTGYNPLSLDLQCNSYACVDGMGEDNCTLSVLVGNPCSDGDACTIGDICVESGGVGVCQAGPPMDCDDTNQCTSDACVGGSCIYTALDGASCDAADLGGLCTDDICVGDVCTPGPMLDCTGFDDQCNYSSCNPGTGNCEYDNTALLGDVCDTDSDECTLEECDGTIAIDTPLSCVSVGTVDCSGFDDQCNTGVCDPVDGLCDTVPVTDGTACDAGDPAGLCTPDDICIGGVCTPDATPVDCSAFNNACNSSACNPGTGNCEYNNAALLGSACDSDSDECTLEECLGAISISTPLTCTDVGTVDCTGFDDQCNNGVCDPADGLCDAVPVTDGTACDAGDPAGLCTPDDICVGGTCTPDPTPVDCSAFNDACNNSDCNPGTGNCEYDNAALVGASCESDSNLCTIEECQGAVSISTPLTCTDLGTVSCDTGNPCTDAVCDPGDGLCDPPFNLPNTTPCDFDGSGCTQDDHCQDGTCSPGTTVTPADCEAALGLDTDCAEGLCVSTGVNTYQCDGAAISPLPGPGSCNADNNGCTLDYCVSSADPDVGAYCTVGSAADCTSMDLLPCQWGVCNDYGDDYSYGCVETYAAASVACDFDSNGCTQNDHCSGTSGLCVEGTEVICTPSDVCLDANCTSTGINTYTCDETAIPDCCLSDTDCTCPLGTNPPSAGGCATPWCNTTTHVCECVLEPAGTECQDYSDFDYPPNCYDGYCGQVLTYYPNPLTFGADNGVCFPTPKPADNNLCSDVFNTDGTTVNTGADSYMGAFANTDPDGTTLTINGSTTCAQNNYEALGDECQEYGTSTQIGANGLDLVYAFQYQTNAANQFDLYSYIIKVEGNYDLGIYIMTDIDTAADCPEGAYLPDDDLGFWGADSDRCNYPYADSPMPPVVEDKCDDTGNFDADPTEDQECCDPCTEGTTCGYKWCTRYYPDGCTNASECPTASCTGAWTYPDDPYNCDPLTTYDENNMASAVIFPDGDTTGSIRTVFVFVDGVGADAGDFQLTVERRQWWASPCDRVNDDARVYDITHVGTAPGETFLGSLEDVVNSMHAGMGSCGGYACFGGWSGTTSCHQTFNANQFWPNTEHFKIHRAVGEGNQTYCFLTDESVPDAADLVLNMWQRSYSGALTICDETYSEVGSCARNNYNVNSIKREFTASEGQLYLIEVSQYAETNRPCLPSLGDDCNYKIQVIEGTCPVICSGPLETPAGANININDPAYGVVNRSGTITSASGNQYYINGWDTYDQVYRMYNNTGVTVNVTLKVCGTWDSMVGLYNCANGLLDYEDWYGNGACDEFTYPLPPSTDPYYVTADSYGGTALGAYTLTVSWGTPPASCVAPATFYGGPVYSSGRTYTGTGSPLTTWVGNTSDSWNAAALGSGPDELWSFNVTGSGTVTLETCAGSAFDTMIRLYNCEGTALTSNDDACSTNRSRVSWAVNPSLSPYYLLVDGWGGYSGAFTVTMY